MKDDKEIIPVLLGADLNCYSMARAFHEAYGVKSYVFGKYELGAVKHSKIIEFTQIPEIINKDLLLDILLDFAGNFKIKPYIFGCTDEYALFIIDNKKYLDKSFKCICPDKNIINELSDKSFFYRKCDELGLPYPESVVVSFDDYIEKIKGLNFDFPVIIKPSNSGEYWRHPFDGMRKVYSAKSITESRNIIEKIFSSGYNKNVIIQKKISGDNQYVITCFSDNGTVLAACAGRVLLGEKTPKGIGNHAAVITEKNKEIFSMASRFLSNTAYNGFSNFDVLKDETDGKYYLLEINPRQGRSNYYMTAAGMNVASIACGDVIFNDDPLCDNEIFWHCVPESEVFKECSEADKYKIKKLISSGKSFSSLNYKYDLKDPRRIFYVFANMIGYFRKYKKYGGK